MKKKRVFVVAITGASGAAYAVRLVEVLISAGCDVHLTISRAATTVLKEELGLEVDLLQFDLATLGLQPEGRARDERLHATRSLAGITSDASSVLAFPQGELGAVHYHHYRDYKASVASGSFLTDGMVVCPCSMGTLSAIVHGTSVNLIHRCAEVHLKERRKLVLVPRETPLSLVHLKNLLSACEAGAVVLPAAPGFYHQATAVQDLVDFVVARICDQLGVAHGLMRRWGE